MTPMKTGFVLESLSLVGPGKPAAELAFTDGLNVVTGASDTGKSYALECIDYAFGARSMARTIPQADGYQAVVVKVRARGSGILFEITRALAGGDAHLREFDASGVLHGEKTLGARHDPKDAGTLSGLLLALSGFEERHVRQNKLGKVRSLSFRDVAFLVLVDEERIISERPPHISSNPTESTVEGATLRLLVTGSEAGEVYAVPRKQEAASAQAQLELVQQLETQVTAEIQRLGVSEAEVEAEIARIESTRFDALVAYEGVRVELVEIEKRIATAARGLRDADARTVVVESLDQRFQLLRQHYDSDLSRLVAVEEAGTLLESFPARACPVCGAAPEAQRGHEAEAGFRPGDVRVAAKSEAAKVTALRSDLSVVLRELEAELAALQTRKDLLQSEVRMLQSKINDELQPRVRTSADALRGQTETRDILLRARTLLEQRAALRGRAEELKLSSSRAHVAPVDTAPTTAELEGFAVAVQGILRQWNYPDAGRVVFSETEQDLVIGGQPRGSHGKGVRALTCAAFIAGLMRHCVDRQLPHPGVVLLDSPLVVYREPDVGPENRRLREAGVKDAFYRTLAAGAAGGQVIIFENEDPPPDAPMTRHHFSKSSTGRYGFIPT